MFEKQKKENMEIKDFFHEFPFIRSFKHRIHRLLKRDDARGRADIIYSI